MIKNSLNYRHCFNHLRKNLNKTSLYAPKFHLNSVNSSFSTETRINGNNLNVNDNNNSNKPIEHAVISVSFHTYICICLFSNYTHRRTYG